MSLKWLDFKKRRELLQKAGSKRSTLRRRLLVHLLFMTLAAFGVLVLFLYRSGMLFNRETSVRQSMEQQLMATSDSVQELVDTMTAYGNNLAKTLSHGIEYRLEESGQPFQAFNDNPELLLEEQRELYAELNTTLKVVRSSGDFAILDATTNTELPEASHSRSAVYLRLSNVSSSVQLDPDVFYFRGIPDLAREKGLELHNRWNLEVDTDYLPEFEDMRHNVQSKGFWTGRKKISRVWEEALFYCAPLRGSDGEFYGMCGMELSELYMRLAYPAVETGFGSLITVLAPMKDGVLNLSDGLIGGQSGVWFSNRPRLVVQKKKGLCCYYDGNTTYVGCHRILTLPAKEGEQWVIALLLPKEHYSGYLASGRNAVLFAILGFILCMVLLSVFVSKKFVQPIVDGIEAIRRNDESGNAYTGISELDQLIEFLNTQPQAEPISSKELPPNIEELFLCFSEGVHQLTTAEYNIFHYYMDGYMVSEIPELAFISLSTVKKHNRSIYTKLNISSNYELMLLVDLFRRCGRLSELEREW